MLHGGSTWKTLTRLEQQRACLHDQQQTQKKNLLHLHPCETTAVHKTLRQTSRSDANFVNLFFMSALKTNRREATGEWNWFYDAEQYSATTAIFKESVLSKAWWRRIDSCKEPHPNEQVNKLRHKQRKGSLVFISCIACYVLRLLDSHQQVVTI